MQYGHDEELFNQITFELGTDKALEDLPHDVRIKIVGVASRARDEFDPNAFVNQHFKNDKVICMDSKDISSVENKLEPVNFNTPYGWGRSTIQLLDYETDAIDYEYETCDDNETNKVKRVLVFSTAKLLKQLFKCLKSIVDGTVKSFEVSNTENGGPLDDGGSQKPGQKVIHEDVEKVSQTDKQGRVCHICS